VLACWVGDLYNHFNYLFSPPSSAESNADDEELPTGKHQAFKNCNFRTDTIELDELVLAVKSLSSDKACGLDEVVTRILKLHEIHCLFLAMLDNIYLSKKPPAEWLISKLIPVHKKGSESDTNSCRDLALMLYSRILLNKNQKWPRYKS
jgi:hypothetical protein